MSKPNYEVIVGNIGSVYYGKDKHRADSAYAEYVKQSKDNYGRAAGESVTMMQSGAIIREHQGTVRGEVE